MAQYRIVIPDEVFALMEWQKEGLPAIGVINQSLASFEPRLVFPWHLSIIVEFAAQAANGMPTSEERETVDQFGDELNQNLKVNGNALFLARITWNGTRQFLYRVHNPEIANGFLMDLIDNNQEIRPFEFRMEPDHGWNMAKWYLQNWEASS